MAGYLGASPVPQSILKKESKTLTANQTTVNTSGYTHGGSISVTLNGVLLEGAGVDYTATNGSDIVLTAGATAGDILHFQAFNEFTLVGQELTTPTINDATLKSNVTLKNDTHEDSDGGRASKIIYQGEQSGGEISTLAEIQASHDLAADDQKGDLIFRTNDGSDGTSPTEALRIDSAQTVGIGTAAPSPTGLAIVTGGGAKGVMLTRNDASGNPTSGQGFGSFGFKGIMDGSNSMAAAEASIEAIASENHSGSTAGTDLAFYTKPSGTGPGSGPTERWRITSTGNLKAATSGLGIDFAATSDANGTAASELFDDYERGSWSPAIVDLGGNAATMATANGKYTKIGSQVIANFGCTISSKGSMTGSYVFISGIPYNHTGSNAGTGIINRYANLSTAASSIALEIGGGIASAAWFTRVTGTSGTADGYLAPSEINSNFFIQGTLIYTVN